MISVIGAGPAGSFYASKEKHDDVHLFEEHSTIGNPISCTGILTESVEQFVKIPKDMIISKIKQFKMVSSNGKSMYVDLKKTNYILHRAKFDQYVHALATENGAITHFNEKFLGYVKKGKEFMLKTNKKLSRRRSFS